MDGRGYGSGFSSWGGPGSRGTHADAVIAKINERLDMLSQLEGGRKGDRYDQYESMDSRSSMASSRDLYRSGSYGYGDGRGDNMLLTHHGGSGYGGGMGMGSGAGFDDYSSYGVAKMRQNMRESFSGGQGPSGGWASASHRSPRRGGNAGGFGRGHSPGGGRGKLPSLLSNRMYPESGGFHQGLGQGPQHFPGRHFGGGPRAGRQRGRKRPLHKQVKAQKDGQKKKPKMEEGDEPESKVNKTESTEGDAAPASEQQDKNGHGEDNKGAEDTPATEGAEKGEADAGDSEQGKKALPKKSPAQPQHLRQRKRRGFVDRVMFACSVCKYRSFYKEDMETHINSRFHKDHFKFLTSQLTKPTTDFLQEYLQNKLRKTEYRVGQLENHSAAICQLFRDQDLTRDLGLEHFMKKVEAAHCGACDLFIPMQLHLIQSHLKSPDHNYNRKIMMEQSKRAGLSIARSILNHKLISKKLESYLKGENPFFDNPDEQEPDDSVAMDVSGTEVSGEQADSQPLEGLLPSEVLEGEPEGGQLEHEGGGAEEATGEAATEEVTAPEEEHMEGAEGAELPPDDEGFELGDEEDGSYVVQDEFSEGLDLGEAPTADTE